LGRDGDKKYKVVASRVENHQRHSIPAEDILEEVEVEPGSYHPNAHQLIS